MLLSQFLSGRFGCERPIARRAAVAAVAGLAALAGGRGAVAQDADATPQISVDYAEPAYPGYDFRLRFTPIPGSAIALIISVPQVVETDSLDLSNAELASAVIIPLIESSPGEMTISGYSPIDVSLETLRTAGVRLRLAIANNTSGSVQITDPISLVSSTPTATDIAIDSSTATTSGTTDPTSSTEDASQPTGSGSLAVDSTSPSTTGLVSTGTVAASVSASTNSSTSTSSDSEGEIAALTASGATSSSGYGTGSGSGSTSTTSAGSFGNGIGKPSQSPWSLNSHLVRLISSNTSFSSHDQPAPIQGSGH